MLLNNMLNTIVINIDTTLLRSAHAGYFVLNMSVTEHAVSEGNIGGLKVHFCKIRYSLCVNNYVKHIKSLFIN